MGPLSRLGGFVCALALIGVSAAAVGSLVDAEPPRAADKSDTAMSTHGGDTMAPQPVRGLTATSDDLTLALDSAVAPRGRETQLAFRIVDSDGSTVADFETEHTTRMHVIVVRRDMTGFQHLHPTQQRDGSWTVPVRLADAGSYRVFADFVVAGRAYTLADDITVDGSLRHRQLPAPAPSVEVDGLTVSLDDAKLTAAKEADLDFTVTRDGEPVGVQDYLGAKGHLVALRARDLAFLHVHPDEERLRFEATFPTAAAYRLFLQFKTEDGQLHTAAFTREITR